MANDNALLVPIQLQAFSLNPAVCGTGEDDDKGARIIPITQPNYTFLRLQNFVVQSDVLEHADLHNTAPAQVNSRMTDLASSKYEARRNRHGIYLHWILPQLYRSGVAATESVSPERHNDDRLRRGLPSRNFRADPAAGEASTPEFLTPPTRWIVVRKLDLGSIDQTARSQFKEYQAWVIESDYLWELDDIPYNYDLEVDVSPFIVGVAGQGDEKTITQQAEVFIGRKTPLEEWSEPTSAKYADIRLLLSGNQFFADFQQHNSNVFSVLDNFEYKGPNQKMCYLDNATASYYLFGWHSDSSSDPLWDEDKRYTHSQRLEAMFMTLVDSGIPNVTNSWLESSEPARLCLHGAMYDVKWDHENKPMTVPADIYAKQVLDQTAPAISMGTTPMDALITYCTARKSSEGLVAKLEEDILAIDSLLHARDDGVEGQREAKDTVYNWSFSRSKGGIHFYFNGEDRSGKPTKPTNEAIIALREVNQMQLVLDTSRRLADQWRWDMFSVWWKFVSSVSNKQENNRWTKKEAKDIAQKLRDLNQGIADLEKRLRDRLSAGNGLLTEAKTGVLPFFYRVKDPTMLVGGVGSDWPTDFNHNVSVRLPVQAVAPSHALPSAVSNLIIDIQKVLPMQTAEVLISEFYALQPNQKPPNNPPERHAYPQFHEKGTPDNPSRDNWGDRQPWVPLYVEWELEYTHIPYDNWVLDEQTARLSDNKMVRYGIDTSGVPLWEKLKNPHDTRLLSGRVLILPQPSLSLKNKVAQLFADTPPQILDGYLNESERKELLDNIGSLQYLSCPLAGLIEGLLTLNMGTHIKPENKELTDNGEALVALKAAQFDSVGLTKSRIELIQGNSGFTPYAAAKDFTNAAYCPFKPVTHGQMTFRKLNIIDKFGQAIVAIDPKPQPQNLPPPPLFPCISDFYEPQTVLQNGVQVANTVRPQNGLSCEFIQLPPQINQPARLNADFIIPAEQILDIAKQPLPYWRPATEWENPIWGWIVVNYADYGIQLFLQDGTFYGEVRIGGPDGTLDEPKWSPFEPDNSIKTADALRLDALIRRLQDKDYLKGVWVMLTTALDSLPPAPDAYAQFLSCTIGKPLALVNMGWSLELACKPLNNQSTMTGKNSKYPERELIGSPYPEDPEANRTYVFHVKLGDKDREYDGLVGYFNGYEEPDKNDEELDYDTINTYFTGEEGGVEFDNLRPLTRHTYPTFKPYWCSPIDPTDDSQIIDGEAYSGLHNAALRPFGAIIDPFTAVHGYTSFLPARALQLPAWTWQSAMENLVAFFHWGPVTITADVGQFAPEDILTLDGAKCRPERNVSVPGLAAGVEWNWLQPYEGQDGRPRFNAFGIEKRGNLAAPGFQRGPYTAIEGFVQLRRPIMLDKDSDTTEGGENRG